MATAAALLLAAAVALPLLLGELSVGVELALASPPLAPPVVLPPPATNSAVALREPQMKDWQKVWPARSFGCASVHCPRHSSHCSEGRVWA
jgi:hypothetical protein